MPRRLVPALFTAALSLVAAPPAAADVAEYVGRPVVAIHYIVEGREATDPSLVDLVETRVGAPLSMADVRESIIHLFSLGRFEDVRVEASAAGQRVTLSYVLMPVHPVRRIEFEGDVRLPGIDIGALRRAIAERYPVIPSLGRAADVASLVEGRVRALGYLRATVAARSDITHEPEGSTIALSVKAGERARIAAIDVMAPPTVSRPDLLNRLDLVVGAPYERERLDSRIADYVDAQRRRGYYEAKAMPSVQLANDGRDANLTLTVVPGPHVHVAFTGDPLPADRRAALVPIEREGSADEDLLEDASNAISEYLRGLGYRDAQAPHQREQSGDELTITFSVNRGPMYRVSGVEISGNASVPLDELTPLLQLREGQPFSGAKLDADTAAIEALYRRRGYASARAQTAVDPDAATPAGQVPVAVRIQIREGVRTLVASVKVTGNATVPEATLQDGLGLKPGEPFFQAQMALDRDTVLTHYLDLGYPSAAVDANPGVSADGARADVVYTVREGPRVTVAHVLIVGNDRTSTRTIRRELQFKTGDPLSLSAVNESQRRLAALGLFRRARISELRGGDEGSRDLIVSVEEAPATTIGYGAGFDVAQVTVNDNGVANQQLEFSPRASFEIGRRNLFGRNRSVNFFSSVNLRRSQTGTGYDFTQYRLLGTFREPRLFETAADALVTGVQEQQRRQSFNFSRRAITAELARHLTREFSISGNYQLQATKVFDEQASTEKPLIDRIFPQVRLSSFSTSEILDARSDPVDPISGHYVALNAQVAGRRIGSEVGLAKVFATAQWFRVVPGRTHVVFAANARLGMATGFPRPVPLLDANGAPVLGADGQPLTTDDRELPTSERFFAGGDTSVRGFSLDTLGTPATIAKDGFALGGNGLVILNAELRVPLRGGLGVVAFVDSGNVFARVADINLGDLRGAVGFGIRYKSPVGPIRIDLGFKLHRDVIAGRREDLTALHISLGQAF